jgi:transposase InsO family protein
MTAKGWYLKYMKDGFDGLMPKNRSDLGKPRSLSSKAVERILEIKNQFPHITGSLVYHKLIEEGVISQSLTSLSSVLRYIRDNNLKAKQLTGIERKAYEMEFSNDCWQSDTSHGPVIHINGRKYQTYLIAFIDDASRMIVGSGFFLNDTAINMQIVLKRAVAKYGVPKRLFVDNGGPYKNSQLEMICASIGTVLINTRPYSPESKGKIERLFRTIKDKWMNGLDWNQYHSLEELDDSLITFIYDKYNNSIHSSIKQTPKDRFLKDRDKLKYKPIEILNNDFLHRETRKVMNDATIKIQNITFEVPQMFIGQKIQIRYYPGELSQAYIYDKEDIIDIFPLKRIDNSKVKRKNTIDYSTVSVGEINV